MNCSEIRTLLDAYLDGELDLVTSLRIEEHLRTCDACRRLHDSRAAFRTAWKGNLPRVELPKEREVRILAAVRAKQAGQNAAPLAGIGEAQRRPSTPFLRLSWQSAVLAVLLLAIGGIGGIAVTLRMQASGPASIVRVSDADSDLIDGHVRSLMAAHIFDVASTNQHTVKPWFAGKIDFAPPVLNLADQGFPLMGGRLDYLEGHPAAALVYHRHQHWINLFIRPSAPGDPVAGQRSERGYTICRWTQAGMAFAAISDLNLAEMQEFVRLQQTGGVAGQKASGL